MTILLTGATGFIGQYFLEHNTEHTIVLASVRYNAGLPHFNNIDAVVHAGGKAHDMQTTEDTNIYMTSNAELTKQVAVAAKEAGVKQFVFISSVKVYGNNISGTMNEYSECLPDDAYGQSKLLAETYLNQLADESFVVSIVRPPLVYGAGVKGNMLKLLKLSDKPFPLPFGNIRNERSLVFAGNLVALINKLLTEKKAGVFIAGDAAPVSTSRLVILIRKHLGKRANLIYIPKLVQTIVKRFYHHLYTRLFGSFVTDNTLTNNRLTFRPPYTTEEGIADMVRWYKKKES